MEDKKIRKFTNLSAAGFIIMAATQLFAGLSLILYKFIIPQDDAPVAFSISTLIYCIILFAIYAAFSALLLGGKKGLGFSVVTGALLLYNTYSLIRFHSASNVFTFMMAAAVLLLTLFDHVPALQDKKGVMKILWVFPPIFELLSQVFTVIPMVNNTLSSAQEQFADASQQMIAVASLLIPQAIGLVIDILTLCFFSYRFYILSLQPQEEAEPVTENYQYHPFG